jgi:hypothetical protein
MAMARGQQGQERWLAKVLRKGKLQDSLVSDLTQERYRAAVQSFSFCDSDVASCQFMDFMKLMVISNTVARCIYGTL